MAIVDATLSRIVLLRITSWPAPECTYTPRPAVSITDSEVGDAATVEFGVRVQVPLSSQTISAQESPGCAVLDEMPSLPTRPEPATQPEVQLRKDQLAPPSEEYSTVPAHPLVPDDLTCTPRTSA